MQGNQRTLAEIMELCRVAGEVGSVQRAGASADERKGLGESPGRGVGV